MADQGSLMRDEDLRAMRAEVTRRRIPNVLDPALEVFLDRFGDVKTAVDAIERVAGGKVYP